MQALWPRQCRFLRCTLNGALNAHTARIRAYYERNTRLFARFGSASGARSIHRALWTPETHTLDAALRTAHQLIAQEHRATDRTTLDLGCGIGGALAHLQAQLPATARLLGVNISPTQAALARRAVPGALIVEADFTQLPFLRCVDVAFAIEAFAHAASAEDFFAAAARVLAPGGRLCLIDDTLLHEAHDQGSRDQGSLDAVGVEYARAFRDGWRTPSFLTLGEITAAAQRASLALHRTADLTPMLRLRALPHALALGMLRAARRAMSRHEIAASIGSVALQQLYARGDAAYRLMVFG